MNLILKANESLSNAESTITSTSQAWGKWGDTTNFSLVDALLVSGIAIVIVFFILALIIFVSWIFQIGIEKINASTKILPEPQNKILDEDEDAVAAVMAAIIDFNKQTGKDVKVVSVTKVED